MPGRGGADTIVLMGKRGGDGSAWINGLAGGV